MCITREPCGRLLIASRQPLDCPSDRLSDRPSDSDPPADGSSHQDARRHHWRSVRRRSPQPRRTDLIHPHRHAGARLPMASKSPPDSLSIASRWRSNCTPLASPSALQPWPRDKGGENAWLEVAPPAARSEPAARHRMLKVPPTPFHGPFHSLPFHSHACHSLPSTASLPQPPPRPLSTAALLLIASGASRARRRPRLHRRHRHARRDAADRGVRTR